MAEKIQPGSGLAILAGIVAIGIGGGFTSVLLIPSWTAVLLTYLFVFITLLIFATVRNKLPISKPRS